MTALALEHVACERGGRRLFEDVTLTLGPGGGCLVRGPNGAGKSSLLRVMAGLLAAAAGTVRINGGIALATEQPALDPTATLARALRFWTALDAPPVRTELVEGLSLSGGRAERRAGLRQAQPERKVREALAAMGIAHLAEVPTRFLSTGQRRRATLAGTIAGARPIWLLDEPTNGLDDAAIGLLEAAIVAHRAGGGIVVVATHQPIALPDAVELVL